MLHAAFSSPFARWWSLTRPVLFKVLLHEPPVFDLVNVHMVFFMPYNMIHSALVLQSTDSETAREADIHLT